MSEIDDRSSFQRNSVSITNQSERTIIVYIEPWADEIELEPGGCIRVDIVSPTLRAIPVFYGVDEITIEGWEGSYCEAWKGGELLN